LSALKTAAKPIGSIILTLIWIAIWMQGPDVLPTPIKTIAIIAVFAIWFAFMVFYRRSSVETTKLSITASLTLIWLALVLFFPFRALVAQGGNAEGASGAVAFFCLMGGLGISVLWIRFLADDITL
jgi:hypothetical protein